jgi:hypothetical protein
MYYVSGLNTNYVENFTAYRELPRRKPNLDIDRSLRPTRISISNTVISPGQPALISCVLVLMSHGQERKRQCSPLVFESSAPPS